MSRPLPDNMRREISGVVSSLVMLADELDDQNLGLEASGLLTEAYSLIILLSNSSLNAAGFNLTTDLSPAEYKSRIEDAVVYLENKDDPLLAKGKMHVAAKIRKQAAVLQKSLKENADWLEGKE